MKKQNADKELLNEVLNWGEKAFAELGDGRRSKKTEPEVLQRLNSSFKTLRADIAARQARGVKLAMEKLLKKAGLGAPEIQAVYIALYSKLLDRNAMQISSLIRAVSGLNDLSSTDAAALFRPRCPLFKSRIMLPGYDGFPANAEFSSYFLHIALGLPVGKARRKAQNLQKISPRQIYGQLSERVIGQEDAKRRVSAAVFRHLKACQLNLKRKPGDRIQKANILIIGPTGTGKTHIARTLSQILKAPLAVCDATQYTEAGYVGMDVEEMLVQLLKAAGNDPERMKNGIIYLDEIDKIASRDARASHYTTKDVSGLSVQQELLKLLDGDVINYRKRSAISERDYEFSVGGVLFVAGGAFQGLEEIVRARLKRKASIGFGGSLEAERVDTELGRNSWLKHIITEDLIEYGFIPEFVGRFASIVTLDPLSRQDVLDILTKPRNSLVSQYSAIFKAAGIKHKFAPEELAAVADEAFALNTGARGLKAIMENRSAPLLFEGGQAAPKAEEKPSLPPAGGGKAA